MEPEVLEQTTQPAEEAISVPAEEQAPLPMEDIAPATLPQPEDVTQRLAEEFLVLAEEFPALSSPSQLPDRVLDMAAGEGIPLLDAYLRYRWQEEKKVAEATGRQEQATRCSTGSLSAGAAQTPPEQDAFLRAFRRAL